MRAVVVLAVGGVVALAVAALTGSTPLAIVVIALAIAGIIQLFRESRGVPGAENKQPVSDPVIEPDTGRPALAADEFSPDISTDPDGPSSDARADQT